MHQIINERAPTVCPNAIRLWFHGFFSRFVCIYNATKEFQLLNIDLQLSEWAYMCVNALSLKARDCERCRKKKRIFGFVLTWHSAGHRAVCCEHSLSLSFGKANRLRGSFRRAIARDVCKSVFTSSWVVFRLFERKLPRNPSCQNVNQIKKRNFFAIIIFLSTFMFAFIRCKLLEREKNLMKNYFWMCALMTSVFDPNF